MEIIIKHEADAQSFAGRLIWDEIPFKVHYTEEGNVVFTLTARIPDYTPLYQGK